MSSPSSPTSLTLIDHAGDLGAALLDVAENSFFAFAVPSEPAVFADAAELEGPEDGAWVEAAVSFHGEARGTVTTLLPRRLAQMLLCGFMGLDPDDPQDPLAIADAAGEFANQVCGAWLTHSARSHWRFDLQPPVVRTVGGGPPDWARAASHGTLFFSVNDLPVAIGLTVTAGA